MRNRKNITAPNQLSIDFDAILQDLFLNGDVHNIKKMLPYLRDHQHDDVAFAEKRFEVGKGVLFTNGTGVGKTLTGLGVAKRFYIQNKKNIIIVVPTDQKAKDWIEEGENIDLYIYKLEGTQDKGNEITVTTYANFYQNDTLNETNWDLIIYDESHYLNQNSKGEQTVYQQRHVDLANLPSAARNKAIDIVGKPPQIMSRSGHWINAPDEEYNKKMQSTIESIVGSTKVLYLSATPFAYHKSIQYADGTLFEINEKIEKEKDSFSGYNGGGNYESFMSEHFGYRMRYNKLTIPETGVDMNLMERQFFETFKAKGIISTRQLEVPMDYSREFITVENSEIGELINKGMELAFEENFQKKYEYLTKIWLRKFNYNYVNQLLECIKAQEIHTRIRQHLDLGRKVVVFHAYNNSVIEHPFHFDLEKILSQDTDWMAQNLRREIYQFNQEFPEYVNLDLDSLVNTRQAILNWFPEAKQFNGTVPKKKRSEYLRDFNSDRGDTEVLIVQQAAGKEGISLHDKTGRFPRVLINLSLPTAPTTAIQTEGRIYRDGVMSNAMYEYITLQTNFEKYAFGTKIAERSKTAENLAMGNLARDLETAFKEGYMNSSFIEPHEGQGTGGKQSDRFIQEITDFQRAMTYYYGRQKKTARNKSSEGTDYYATPEPLGYKMVEWMKPKPDEKGLEPSAGHGAIARFFPGTTINHFVEPSYKLSSQLSINVHGDIKQYSFEDYHITNKADFIVMNPPFGIGGKTAAEHILKCVNHHMGIKGRLMAIIPRGPSMQKRMEDIYQSKVFKMFVVTREILLPNCLFTRAGTNVSCKIVKIESKFVVGPDAVYREIDLSYIQNIEEFFETIENLEL